MWYYYINKGGIMNCIVIGDFALDINHKGKYSGYSREIEGLPIFHTTSQTINGGGAANLAGNLASLGNTVFAIGAIGSDMYGRALQEWMQDYGILWESTFMTEKTQVYGKYWLGNQHYMRNDIDPFTLDASHTNIIIDDIQRVLDQNKIDVIILADYNELGYRMVVESEIIKFVSEQKPLSIASSRENMNLMSGIDILVGNEQEMDNIFFEYPTQIITLGERGAKLIIKDETEIIDTIPAQPPIDPCGCGDTFLAVLATMLCQPYLVNEAIQYANAGARWTSKKIATTGFPNLEQVKTEFHTIYVEGK